ETRDQGHGCICCLRAIRRLPGPRGHAIISQRKVATPMGTGGRAVGRLMSRTVIWLVVAGALVVAVGLGVAWRGKLSDRAVLEQALEPAARNPQAAGASPATPPAPSAAAGAAPSLPSPAGQSAAMVPSF